MVDEARMKQMLFQNFQYGTTYSNDYQEPPKPLSEKQLTVYKEKKKCVEKKPVRPMKDTQTLSVLKPPAIPFDLMIKRKDIIGTTPKMWPRNVDDQNIDTGLEEAIRTRPRLVLSPAVPMDDIPNKHARDILVAETYTSSTARALQQAVKPYVSVKGPLVEDPASGNPLTLPSLQLPKVPPEWRMESITWDSKQLRCCHCFDPDKEFWIEHQSKMKECSACKETSLVRNHWDLQRQRNMSAARRYNYETSNLKN